MLQEEPNDSFLNYALALEYGNTGNVTRAIDLIESLLDRDPDYLGAYYQLGKYYEALKETEKAIASYNRGIVIARKKNNRKALGELNEALLSLED